MPRRTLVLLFLAIFGSLAWGQKPALRLEQTIPLAGVEGRIDHLSADVGSRRVFISALGNGTVEAIDLNRGRRIGEIKGLREPQGVLYLPKRDSLYVATGGDGMVRLYNAKTLAPAGSISLGDDADNLRFGPEINKIAVGYGSGAIAFLSPDLSGKVEVRLPVHPESFQFTSGGAQLLVNLPNDGSIALVDASQLRVVSKWTHLGAQANFPMAVDLRSDRFFAACRTPAQLLELNQHSGSVVQRMKTVGDADDLFYDQQRGRVYVIGGEGYVDVVEAPKNGKLHSIAHVSTAPGARTGLFVPAWNQLLVAAPRRGNEPARLLVYTLP